MKVYPSDNAFVVSLRVRLSPVAARAALTALRDDLRRRVRDGEPAAALLLRAVDAELAILKT